MKLGSANVSFQHLRDVAKATTCTLVVKNKVHTGIARCSKEDSFCRDTGRKVSLSKALQSSDLTKRQRKNVWEDYRNMTNTPRW